MWVVLNIDNPGRTCCRHVGLEQSATLTMASTFWHHRQRLVDEFGPFFRLAKVQKSKLATGRRIWDISAARRGRWYYRKKEALREKIVSELELAEARCFSF